MKGSCLERGSDEGLSDRRLPKEGRMLFALLAILGAGCDVTVNLDPRATCSRDGQTYVEGDRVPSADACTQCECTTEGQIECGSVGACGCEVDGIFVPEGEVFYDAACDECECDGDGAWTCGAMACPDPPTGCVTVPTCEAFGPLECALLCSCESDPDPPDCASDALCTRTLTCDAGMGQWTCEEVCCSGGGCFAPEGCSYPAATCLGGDLWDCGELLCECPGAPPACVIDSLCATYPVCVSSIWGCVESDCASLCFGSPPDCPGLFAICDPALGWRCAEYSETCDDFFPVCPSPTCTGFATCTDNGMACWEDCGATCAGPLPDCPTPTPPCTVEPVCGSSGYQCVESCPEPVGL